MIECKCDNCNRYIDNEMSTYCQKCYDILLQEIDGLESEISSLKQTIDDLQARD